MYAVASSPHSAVHTKEHPSAGARCYAYHHPATEIATQWSIEFQVSTLNSKIPRTLQAYKPYKLFLKCRIFVPQRFGTFFTVPKSSWTKTLASDQTLRVSWTHLVLPESEDLAKLRCFGGFLCHLLLPLRAIHSSWLIHVCYQRGGETSQTCHPLLSKVGWKWRRKPLNIPTTAFFPHPLTPFSLWPSDSRQILRGIMPALSEWKVKVGRSLYLNMWSSCEVVDFFVVDCFLVWKITRKHPQILDIRSI